MQTERRSAVRFALKFPALIKWSTPDGSTRFIEDRTANISARGVFFNTRWQLPRKALVSVDLISRSHLPSAAAAFEGPESSYISVPGNVVRQDRTGLAIAFDRGYRIYAIQDRLVALRKELDWIHRHQGGPRRSNLSVVS
jgi:hypothetical protein